MAHNFEYTVTRSSIHGRDCWHITRTADGAELWDYNTAIDPQEGEIREFFRMMDTEAFGHEWYVED